MNPLTRWGGNLIVTELSQAVWLFTDLDLSMFQCTAQPVNFVTCHLNPQKPIILMFNHNVETIT